MPIILGILGTQHLIRGRPSSRGVPGIQYGNTNFYNLPVDKAESQKSSISEGSICASLKYVCQGSTREIILSQDSFTAMDYG